MQIIKIAVLIIVMAIGIYLATRFNLLLTP